jgi:hypothetical protein
MKRDAGQDTLIDEEDHALLSRLIQKYQRDFSQLQTGTKPRSMQANKVSYNSHSTLNLNSLETQGLQNQSAMHKKLHSVIYQDKGKLPSKNDKNQLFIEALLLA